MSDAATRDRASRQQWAVPGSTHDRLVRFTKIALPSAIGAVIAFLALAPLDRHGDTSFILDKNQVQSAPERMRVDAARYVGADNQGRKFEVTAHSAVQRSSSVPIVEIHGMLARLALADGPATVDAETGRYNLDQQQVEVTGPVRALGPDGYRLQTSDVTVDLKNHQLHSGGPVTGEMRLGTFSAGHLSADLANRTVILDGGARLKIVQGAVR